MYKITVPVQVYNEHFNKEKTLAELKRSGAHRVALTQGRVLDDKETMDSRLRNLEQYIKYFKENGLETVVWMGETLGHNGGPANKPSHYTHIRNINNGEIAAYCPLDPEFKKAMSEWAKGVALAGADMIMIDDDFRLNYRGGIACCCDRHLAKFEEELGEKADRDKLQELMFSGGENKYRSAWLKVQGESMYDFARALRSAVDQVNPDIRLSFCSPPSWDSEGWDPMKMSKIMAGKNKPFIRTIDAPYWAACGFKKLSAIAEYARCQLDMYKGRGAEVFTEGDTYPRPRYECPASFLECFDMIMRADGNADGILKYMLDYISDADYETGYIDEMLKNAENYKWIEKNFKDKTAVGVRPYVAMHIAETIEVKGSGALDQVQNVLLRPSLKFTSLNSLPTSYEKGNVNVCFGEDARYIPEEELKYGSIIDLTAAKILMERGIDVGIESIACSQSHEQTEFTDIPYEYFVGEGQYTRLEAAEIDLPDVKCSPDATPVTKHIIGQTEKLGAYQYENAQGMRFLVYLFDMYSAENAPGWLYGYAKKRQLQRSIEWLGRKPLRVFAEGNSPRLYILGKEDSRSMTVGLWNLFEDKAEGVKVKLAQEAKSVEFMNCSGKIEGNYVILDSAVYPYEFVGFVAEY